MEALFTWGNLSALLIVISGIPYMWGIYKRTILRPVASTWGIWSIIGLLFLVAYYDAGARMDTTLPAAWAGFIDTLIIFILSLIYGEKSWSRLETWCVAICFISVIAWQSLESALLGLIGAIIADAMGVIPQIRKIWVYPNDEPWFPWVLFCVGSMINIFGIKNWELDQYLYPIYMTICSLLITIPIVMGHIKSKREAILSL